MNNASVYVVIANDEERVKECFVFDDADEADGIFKRLKIIYGGANVALCSRKVNDIPFALQQHSTTGGQTMTQEVCCDRLQLLMAVVGLVAACLACYYGAAPLGGLAIGMVAGLFVPLIAIVVLEPWFGPFHCGGRKDD